MVVQQDKPIQINQWVFIFTQSKVIKASVEQSIDDSMEIVELNELNRQILWHMVESYPSTITANELLTLLDDDNVTRNKLYQAIAKLRRIFDDSTHNAFYIETVPRKGYCWLVEPLNRELILHTQTFDEQKHNGIDEHQEEKKLSNSSVLDTNIFDDLGFIENSHEEETKPVTSAIESQSTVSPDSSKVKKHYWILIAIVLIALFVFGKILYKPEPAIAFVASDQLYISPLNIHDKSSNISPQTLNKIQWWLEQKLHHIPAMTILLTSEKNKVPRIDTLVERKDESIKITLTFVPKQIDALPQKILTIIKPKLDANSIIQDDFNHRITQLVAGSDNTTVSNDICILNSFITSQNSSDNCLIDLYQQYKILLTSLNNDITSQADKKSAIMSLAILANKTISLYENNSLGYQMLASFYQKSEEFDKAHEQLLLAMERNQNESEIIKSLSESYRRIGDFNSSLLLVEVLLTKNIDMKYAYYWKAHDLVALGYLHKAQKIVSEKGIELTTLQEKVYFFGINYNQLTNILSNDENYDSDTLSFINEIINDDVYCNAIKSSKECIEDTVNKVDANFHITQWKAAIAHLSSKNFETGYKLIQNDPWITKNERNLIGSGDRIFFIPSLANMLMKMGKTDEATELLKQLITFIQTSNTNQMYSLTLAEAYTLLGQYNDALDQMEKLLAQGWLPNTKYQIWTLVNNPNFEAINKQWQFLNLLELIDNRRKLLKLRVADLKKLE